MTTSVGILAFGSLIDIPGAEIEKAVVGRKLNVHTPFGVEFARSSTKRGGAPTLVPLEQSGASVLAQILLLNVSEQDAKDRLWRRDINRVGQLRSVIVVVDVDHVGFSARNSGGLCVMKTRTWTAALWLVFRRM